MSSVVISGNTSGTVTLAAPDVAGTTVITLPSTSQTLNAGTLIGYNIYTTVGANTYTKATNNPSFIIVEVVGGGGCQNQRRRKFATLFGLEIGRLLAFETIVFALKRLTMVGICD